MYHLLARLRVVALASAVCVSIAVGAMRVRSKEQLLIDEPIGAATSDPHDKEVQHLINELFPSNPHYEDLQPAIDELLASNPHYEEQPLADETTRETLHKDASLEETLREEDASLQELVAREKRKVASQKQLKSSIDSPVVPAASAPRKKRRAWSADEDEQLKHLVAEHGSKSWSVIATRLRDRNGVQCSRRWLSFLQPQLKKSEWTPDEDQDIRKGVSEIGRKWAQIRKQYVPNRSDTDIRNRWRSIIAKKSSHHIAKRQWWSAVEDEQLKHLVVEHDEYWVAIAARMQDRNAAQCSKRWRYYLRPQLNKSEWTPEEDQDILKGVSDIGRKWAQIREEYMPNRSVADIGNRWSSIIRKSRARQAVRATLQSST